MATAKTPPWKKKRPSKPRKKLTEAQKSKARATARKAGRRYPNLVDNMNAAKAKKKPAATKRPAAKKRGAK